MSTESKDQWLYTISSKRKLININFKEIWQYRDLLLLFVKRDVITVYKQTILGPLWYFIQPLFTAITFTLIFNKVANIETGAVPPFLFNLASVSVWGYFRTCLTATSDTFKSNAAIFSKVYFPRIISPLSLVTSNLVKFGIQMLLFICFYIYYYSQGASLSIGSSLLFFPLLVVLMAMLGLGLGMIISSMVTKYRDLKFLVAFGVQLLMYISAVMYPLALIREKLPKIAWLVEYNPMAYIIESARYMLLGEGTISTFGLVYTVVVTIVIFFVGIIIFNKTEKTFIDTV
ncbi:ABC transporter permease [Psychroserpens sp.]|uniref:ABC transporter permease n=1 Tax=Psychroserpens sp. TaxID=2020870 RepID=UPI001B28E8DF|nr:ABC transporter permease [Psychroserpens sp.]MBO6606946.1 ABC transporter permease [Psychroserpens sp.]MBO6630834.1 ABC transporter permease [Psychroserpens sp.]MBO6654092.1 ABC transporter permease [Psychroserpens sp.]MBO6682622.1 ABC transporter permease [Psychroserpens sp.]MBO6750718.1 ABC transporter permease [Psychroserpens sp.]